MTLKYFKPYKLDKCTILDSNFINNINLFFCFCVFCSVLQLLNISFNYFIWFCFYDECCRQSSRPTNVSTRSSQGCGRHSWTAWSWGGSYGNSTESDTLLKCTVGPADLFGVLGLRRKWGSWANGWVIGCLLTTAEEGAEGPQLKILMFDLSSEESGSELLHFL